MNKSAKRRRDRQRLQIPASIIGCGDRLASLAAGVFRAAWPRGRPRNPLV